MAMAMACSGNQEFRIEPRAGYEQLIPGAAEGEQWSQLFAPLQPGAVEVTYYFAYACEHCFAFEPQFQHWLAKPRSDAVLVRYVPVGLRPEWVDHARLFYAADSENIQQELHAPLFDAIHRQQPELASNAEALADFAAEHGPLAGGDSTAVLRLMDSDAVTSAIKHDNLKVRAWRLNSTPTLTVRVGGVHGDSYFRITNTTARVSGGIIHVLDQLLGAVATN